MTILEEIQAERKRQDDKWGEQNHPFTDLKPKDASYLAAEYKEACDFSAASGGVDWEIILLEEVYEALEQAAHKNVKEFREELIQTAAVVVAMIECLDRNGLK